VDIDRDIAAVLVQAPIGFDHEPDAPIFGLAYQDRLECTVTIVIG
jgi:hypothetical protein